MAVRTFIAVEMSESVRTKLATLIGRLRHAGADAKWVAAENIHLTLKFLGDVDEAKMADVERIVAASVAGIAPFEFEVRGTGGFPDLRRPR
ncbi:MAG: RNA 2',3'-cyclic phosphodiesterase, partial [Planctomycetes bacterium]|nr:RNA 2',3'-cyclic phosphodiesterase [Planctomycetota bacterium]